jgi:hypothetical protein
MTTINHVSASWIAAAANQKPNKNLWQKWLAVADGQAANKTEWFAASLVVMGVLFLPIPAVLIYNYNASIIVLVISMVLFFGNFIAGMGGSNIRVTLTLFVISIVTYLTMATIVIL